MTQEKSLNKITQDRAISDFIKSEYPTFVAFLDAYFEYLEQQKNTADVTINLRDYRNVDETLDEFIEYFRKEYLVNIPVDIQADKALLVNQITKFYREKGNEASYRFLFRLIYNEDIEFYYPKVDILRASDGKWFEQRSIKITLTVPENLFVLDSKQIVGQTSGATAIVESALLFTERGTDLVELTLSEISGTFQFGEQITVTFLDDTGTEQTITETILEIFSGINVVNAGSGYAIDDIIIIRDQFNAEIAKGIVKEVSKGPITSLSIDAAGTGYNGTVRHVTRFYALPGDWTLDGDYLPDTEADGTGSGASGNDYTQYTFDEIIPLQVIPSVGDNIDIVDSDTSFGFGAFGIISIVGNDGEILEVQLLAQGEEYQQPTANILTQTGTGGDIGIIGGGGAVADAVLDGFPVVIESDRDSNGFNAFPDFTAAGDGNATGTLISGTLAEYPGRYLNEDGHLSSSKRLQDSFFYQDYSYVIKVGLAISEWRDIIKRIAHPAGLAFFGEISFFEELDVAIDLQPNITRELVTEVGTNEAVMTEAVIKLFVNDSNGDAVIPVLDSNGNHLIDWEKDTNGQYVQT